MKYVLPTRTLGAVTALVVVIFCAGAAAQEAVLQGMHAKGSVGLNYSRDASGRFTGQGIGQELSTDVTGSLFNPNFVAWSTSFSYGHNASYLLGTDAGNNSMAGSFNAFILPSGSFPLAIAYQRTRVGLGQSGVNTNTNTDRFSIDWRINLARLPKIAFRYGKDSTSSDVPVGLYSTNDSQGSGIGISASDTWRGWDWNAGWMTNDSSVGTYLLSGPARIHQNNSIVGGDISRQYLGGRGFLTYNFSRNASDASEGTLSYLNGTEMTHSASTSLRITPQLTTFGAFQHYAYSSQGRVFNGPEPDQYTYVLAYPSKGYAANGGVVYRLHPHITVSDSAGYSSATTTPSASEQGATYFANTTAVNGNYTLRTIILNGSYGVGYSRMTTTRDRSLGGLRQDIGGSAAWTRPWLSLTGAVNIGHSADGVLPNSFENGKRYSFSAESARLGIGKVRFRWALQDRELLGFVGYINRDTTSWTLALSRRHWQVEGGHNVSSGAHQAFGHGATAYEPLPNLVGVVLTDDGLNSWFTNGSIVLRTNLRIAGTFRRDENEFFRNGATASYSAYEIHVDYRLGKIVMNATYGHYNNISWSGHAAQFLAPTGSSADRFRFRIVRSFNLF